MYQFTKYVHILRLSDGAFVNPETNEEYKKWILAGNVPAPRDAQEVADEVASTAKEGKNATDSNSARQDAKLQAFAAMTPMQVRAWIAANVANLADAKDALATLAVAVSILARRL